MQHKGQPLLVAGEVVMVWIFGIRGPSLMITRGATDTWRGDGRFHIPSDRGVIKFIPPVIRGL